MVTIRIYIKPYLAAYLKAHYTYCTVDGVIRFSKNQNLYSCLLKLTVPRPKGVSWKEEGNVTLALPCPAVGKDPRTYNYLSAESREKFEKEVNYEMRMDYYGFLRKCKFTKGMMYTRATEIYLEEHHMTGLIPEETLIKSFYLWLKKLQKERVRNKNR